MYAEQRRSIRLFSVVQVTPRRLPARLFQPPGRPGGRGDAPALERDEPEHLHLFLEHELNRIALELHVERRAPFIVLP